MENLENPYVVLLQITDAFEALHIDYVVVGSIASSIHGEYRASGDIDIVADLNFPHVEPIGSTLRDRFYVDYLKRWSERFGLADLLERALKQSQ